jgi:4-hydroxy-tetrahydrodipicolinate synthase
MTSLTEAFARLAPRRPHGIAAVLLPFEASGGIDWAGFEAHVARTHDAGLDCAVNMDTGFGDLLDAATRRRVLESARGVLGAGVRLYAGAYPEPGEVSGQAWNAAIADVEACEATPVLVQSASLHGRSPAEAAAVYAEAAASTSAGALAFELSPRFAPHGEIWDDETFARILDIPKLLGAKHSSLDRAVELRRLEARDRERPAFRVYTGNDLAIDMVAYGSDYLLGLATFAPARFAERDAFLARGDERFLSANDALQHLGNVGFRAPIPAYKHAAAQFLHLCRALEGDAIHPRAPRRPASERILLLDCALRLGLVDEPERVMRERVRPFLEKEASGVGARAT